jgi:hypothetical protein
VPGNGDMTQSLSPVRLVDEEAAGTEVGSHPCPVLLSWTRVALLVYPSTWYSPAVCPAGVFCGK